MRCPSCGGQVVWQYRYPLDENGIWVCQDKEECGIVFEILPED